MKTEICQRVVRSSWPFALLLLVVSCEGSAPQPSPDSTTPSDSAVEADSMASRPGETVPPADVAEDPAPGPLLLTPDGWGSLRIGMSRAEVVAAAGEDAHPEAVGGPDPERCDEFRPRDAPEGVLVMLENGVLTRISVSGNADIATPSGFHVGDSSAAILERYGARASVEPHQYQESPASYITVWRDSSSGPDRRGIRYEIDSDGIVSYLRGGGPSIEYVEGCV